MYEQAYEQGTIIQNYLVLEEGVMPRPELWDKYVINQYFRPKGLHSYPKVEKLSESEQLFPL